MKVLFLLLDGLGDVRYRQLGGKSPLEKAKTPNLDRLAFNGYCGTLVPLGLNKEIPISDASLMTFSNLGYDVRKIKPSRGVVEAIGAGFKVKDGYLCARTNFAIVDKNWTVKDLRAGRIKDTEKLEKKVNSIKFYVPFKFKSTVGHRGVLIFYGKFSGRIPTPDPHKIGARVRKSSKMLNDFMTLVYNALKGEKANFLLMRGLGSRVPKIKKFGMRAAAVVRKDDVHLDKGIVKIAGMKVMEVPEINGKAVEGAFKKHDFVFVPYKGTDPPGHDGDYHEKVRQIERADRFIGGLNLKNKLVIVTSDHCTVCKKKSHTTDPIPTLISFGPDSGKRKFGERHCTDFKIPSHKLMDYSKKAAKISA
jgi:2,3-bisphosphoglycerate-independent phosphoglycerate mutase